MGYGYETPIESGLSGLSVRTHEISLRFKFGATSEVEEVIKEIKKWGGKLIEPTYTKNISSNLIKKKILNN